LCSTPLPDRSLDPLPLFFDTLVDDLPTPTLHATHIFSSLHVVRRRQQSSPSSSLVSSLIDRNGFPRVSSWFFWCLGLYHRVSLLPFFSTRNRLLVPPPFPYQLRLPFSPALRGYHTVQGARPTRVTQPRLYPAPYRRLVNSTSARNDRRSFCYCRSSYGRRPASKSPPYQAKTREPTPPMFFPHSFPLPPIFSLTVTRVSQPSFGSIWPYCLRCLPTGLCGTVFTPLFFHAALPFHVPLNVPLAPCALLPLDRDSTPFDPPPFSTPPWLSFPCNKTTAIQF